MGSDHSIISISTPTAKFRRGLGTVKITDWKKFRECLSDDSRNPEEITSIRDWCSRLKEKYKHSTRFFKTSTQTPNIDSHLAHLWEARDGLTRRWKRQKRNRKLKERIAEITRKAREYADVLARQNWIHFCESLQGTLSTSKTWEILRSMLDPLATRTESNHTLKRIAHTFQGSNYDLIEALKDKLKGTHLPRACNEGYRGKPNELMDREITKEEVYSAMMAAKKNSALDPME